MPIPNFNLARIKAYELLKRQKALNLKIVVSELQFPDKTVYFDTYQNYARITGKDVAALTARGKLDEGYTILVPTGEYIVLHNGDCEDLLHLNWTNAHEIGHVELGHVTDGPIEEIEAHFFAACLLMPDAVIKAFYKNGFKIDFYFLTDAFNVSYTAACKKIDSINKFMGIPVTPLDQDILRVFLDDILAYPEPYSISFINA